MKSVSADLAAAIEARERTPVARIRVDWDGDGYGDAIDDLSEKAGSLDIKRTLSSDVPEQLRVVDGSTAAASTVDLARGDTPGERQTAARYFSIYNPDSALYGKEQLGRPCRIEVGMATSAGPEYVTRLQGWTRALDVNAGSGTAQMMALDHRAAIRTPITLPPVAANAPRSSDTDQPRRPGLESTWLVSYIAYQLDLPVSPLPRSQCRLWIPMHGSAWPMLSDTTVWINHAYLQTPTGDRERLRFDADAPYLLATRVEDLGYRTVISARCAAGEALWETGGRARLKIEMWIRPSATSRVQVVVTPTGVANHSVTITVGTSGAMQVVLVNGATTRTINATTPLPTDGAWHRLGVYVNDNLGQARFGVDALADQVVAFTTTPSSPFTETTADCELTLTSVSVAEVHLEPGGFGDAWHLDDSFTPRAVIDRSAFTLQGVPDTSPTDAWELLTDLASAEQAAVWFSDDEEPVLHWRTRARLVSAEGQTVQTELTSTTSLLDLAYTNRMDQIRNVISVGYTPVQAVTDGEIYSATSTTKIFLNPRATHTLTFEAPGPVSGALTFDAQLNTSADGGGIVRTWGTHATATYTVTDHRTVTVTITNLTGSGMWLVDTSGDAAFTVLATHVVTDSAATSTARNEQSISTYGEQPFSLAASRWIQDPNVAAGLAVALAEELGRRAPVITGVRIIGDPRLELGDRIRVADPDGIVLDGEYWLTGCDDSLSDTYTQAISARPASYVAVWDDPGWVWGDDHVWGA